MKRQEFLDVVKAVGVGNRIKITYKDNAIPTLPYLIGMYNAGLFTLEDPGLSLLYAIVRSQKWDREQNKTFLLVITESFDLEWFVDRLHWDVESVEVIIEN